ncbi:helix-turn-helix domain-containing protein [Paenibacillus sp. Root444D2]|uniref:helix-turn-helix domain-containing protein n=1 Tax=Paenibacillus sp. Root444D2 TaxID=1736538 RepID=UPI000708FC36|nr:AraC family transcriptional regulator [Paenibacillus sp. Root444D2]KQX64894.1 AraC family transcriptional regulator [Paenibacillus sp. Root444D2]
MNRLMANRGLLQIFFALLLVIVIMFVSNYVVYKNSISGIYEKVTQNNRLAIKNIIQSFDSSFTNVNNLMFSIQGLPYDNLESAEDKRIDMTKAYTMQENISRLASSVDYIEDVIVFYNNIELAVTAKGTSDLKILFEKKYKHESWNYEYWRAFAKSKHALTFFPVEDFSVSNDGLTNRKQRLMVAMDGNKVRMSDKNVMVLLNADKLLKKIDLSAMIPGASLIVLDANRNMIFSTDKEWNLDKVLNDVYFNSSQESSLTRENFEYNFYRSEYNDYIYINKVPYQFQNINSVATANHMIMISAIISAVLLSAFLSIYLYRPVKDILKLLGGGHVKGNDFRKIYSGIVSVQAENESLKKQMDFVDSEMRRGIFLQMLDGFSHAQEYDIQMQKYYSDFFRKRQFVMAVLHVKRLEEYDQPLLRIDEMTDILSSGLSSKVDHSVVFHAGSMQFLALIGIEQASERKTVMDALESFVNRAMKEELKGYSVWGCVSKLYDSKVSNCNEAYQDITYGMLYRNVNMPRTIVDMDAIRYVSDIYFPFEKIEKLSHTLLSGKADDGIRIVAEIIQENKDRNIHYHQLAHIAKCIFFYLSKQVEDSSSGNKDFCKLEMDFCWKVDNAFGYGEIQNALIEVVRFIANKRNHDQKSKLNPEFISQYIELHYMENLYLDHMAEVLNTSPKYFSNYFKKTFGINYVEYFNKVRLSHAKEYLKHTELSIAEIGEKTGYLNSSTFTTTFKKYCGISPSEYRKKPVD